MDFVRKAVCVTVAGFTFTSGAALAVSADNATTSAPAESQRSAEAASPNSVIAVKLIVSDLPKTQAFYETMFGLKEVNHFSAADRYDEPILGFNDGKAQLALFAPNPKLEAPLKKSAAPVVLIYTPEFQAVVKRIQDAKYPVNILSGPDTNEFSIAIAKDPSGNAVEILARPMGQYEVGGAKLNVDNRERAENFFIKVFGFTVSRRFQTKDYDEVVLRFGKNDTWIALFESKTEAPLLKSQYPVVAMYTSEFNAVLKRLDELKYGYREVKSPQLKSRIVIAKDPAGNGVEIIEKGS